MKAILHGVCLFIAVVLTPTLFAAMEIFGVTPNLFIVYIVFASFYISQKEGIWLGLIAGLMYGVVVGHSVVVNGILFMFACFLNVMFCENMLRRSNIVMSVAGVAVWTVIIEMANSLFSPVSGMIYRLSVTGFEAVYNGIVMLILYIPMEKIFKRLYDEKR